MNNLLGFMKSTRSIVAVMAMLLLFLLVIGSWSGANFPNEILTLVGTTVGAVVTAYFGKRDKNDE